MLALRGYRRSILCAVCLLFFNLGSDATAASIVFTNTLLGHAIGLQIKLMVIGKFPDQGKTVFSGILKPNRIVQKQGEYFAYRYRDGTAWSGWIVQPTYGTDWHVNF
ncbi:MAG: hypothetical protein JO308_04360 [Verrucomicrobia bacterium]|nr:hypothetical protein [Verrucomicrobiota bacterium]